MDRRELKIPLVPYSGRGDLGTSSSWWHLFVGQKPAFPGSRLFPIEKRNTITPLASGYIFIMTIGVSNPSGVPPIRYVDSIYSVVQTINEVLK